MASLAERFRAEPAPNHTVVAVGCVHDDIACDGSTVVVLAVIHMVFIEVDIVVSVVGIVIAVEVIEVGVVEPVAADPIPPAPRRMLSGTGPVLGVSPVSYGGSSCGSLD